jgi:hypothetical protein
MDENCKTVFVLDHTPYFGISGEEPLHLEIRGSSVNFYKKNNLKIKIIIN